MRQIFVSLSLILSIISPSIEARPSEQRNYPTIQMDSHYLGENIGDGINIHGVRQRTYYVGSDLEREAFRIHIRDSLLFDSKGNPIDATDGIKFVMDEHGNLFGGPIDKPGFHSQHSAYLGGKPVAFAGRMKVENGHLTWVDNSSGHYKTPMDAMKHLLMELKIKGIDTSKFQVNEFWMAKHPSRRDLGAIYGPAKTGDEFLEKFTLSKKELTIRHLVPRDFWDAASDWLSRDFPHKKSLLRTLSAEKKWPQSFWDRIPELINKNSTEVRLALETAVQNQLRDGNISREKYEQVMGKTEQIGRERRQIIESIRRKILESGACEL